ncbi:hypothetical protein [Streptomyces sp. NPDC004376]
MIEELRPFQWGFWYMPRYSYAIWGASLGSWASWIISSTAATTSLTSYLIFAACVLAGILIGFAVGGFFVRKARLEIWLTRDDFPVGYWRFSANEVVTATIAILGLIAAIVFGVTAHKDAQKDEGGAKSSPAASRLCASPSSSPASARKAF